MLNTIFSILFSSNDNDETSPSGPNAVRMAIQERKDLIQRTFTAKLGEPDIVEQDGRFYNDPKIIIPVYDCPFEDEQSLVFDIPEEDGDYQFNELLEMFDLSINEMQQLVGREIPVTYIGGNLFVDWDERLEETSDFEKGAEEDVAGALPSGKENGNDEESSGVNVEETVISGEGDDE